MKYNQYTLTKLEKLLQSMEYTVRYGQGNFQSGHCIVHENKVVVINKFYDIRGRINTLIDIVKSLESLQDNLDEKERRFLDEIKKLEEENTTL